MAIALFIISCDVPVEFDGQRLDRALVGLGLNPPEETEAWERFSGLSRARLQKLIDRGEVQVAGASRARSFKVLAGQPIVITLPEPAPVELVPEPMDLVVLYEDSDLIVVDKPAGLVVHPGAGHFSGTLVHGLLAHCQDLSGIGGEVRPGIVHRLDRDTSGCIVVAKNDKAHEGIATQFAERRVHKHYEAFVIGEPNPARGVIDTMFGRHATDRKRFSSKVKHGKRALTSYAVVKSGGGLARVVIELGTGRTHQIRVHLADRGYPVVGDVMYGGQRWGSIRDKQLRELAKGLKRHALHAARLEFAHPVTGAPLQLESPLPPELSALAQVLDDLSGE